MGFYKPTLERFSDIEHFDTVVVPMLKMCPKLVLTGSVLLWGLFLLPKDRKPGDIDFNLLGPLTEQEKSILIDFFKLHQIEPKYDEIHPFIEDTVIPANQFFYVDSYKIKVEDTSNILEKPTRIEEKYIHIDVFKREYLTPRETIIIEYKNKDGDTTLIKCSHPSVPISYKVRFALSGYLSSDKHQMDFNYINNHRNLIKGSEYTYLYNILSEREKSSILDI